MRSVPSSELVDKALSDHSLFKAVGAELERRDSDEGAVQRLISAFRDGQAPAWLTAHLLGCMGHDIGYDTVFEILRSAPGLLAESYAGPALVKIRGARAFDDLRRLLNGAPKRRSREGAAWGLARLPSRDSADSLFDAAQLGLIGYQTAASVLASLPVDASRVRELLSREDPSAARLATEILWVALTSPTRGRSVPDWLVSPSAEFVAALRDLLSAPNISMAPRKRREVAQWARTQLRGAAHPEERQQTGGLDHDV